MEKLCHCGKVLPEQRWAKHGGGRPRVQCSARCTAIATKCRYYGLDPKDFWSMHDRGCSICGYRWKDGDKHLAIDHEHVDDYTKLSAEDRRRYVRGILCIFCNRHRVAMNDLEDRKSTRLNSSHQS